VLGPGDPEPARAIPYIGRMLARLGARLSAFFRATAPDPFVIAVLLTVVAGVVSAGWDLALGSVGGPGGGGGADAG
jgi:hypothetical protein